MFADKLPVEFTAMLKGLLGEDGASRYAESLEHDRIYGLRANLLKVTPEAIVKYLPFLSHTVPWCEEGFYYTPEYRPSKSIWRHAGLFYTQEPSAMLPAAVADIEPGHTVLDICAAPGGKTTQAAGYLRGSGLIVANDVSISRCKPLVKNIELSGVTNAVVLCERPERLTRRFPHFFDRILVDAPCSGEGMFRKDPDAVSGWSGHKPEACAAAQRGILNQAADMLKPGGRIVYSTCTFEPREDEDMIEWFLNTHKGFYVVPLNHKKLGITGTALGAGRIWPHLQEGEGHFVCVLGNDREPRPVENSRLVRRVYGIEYFSAFCEEYLTHRLTGDFFGAGESLYRIPEGTPDLNGIRTVRSGWYLGEVKNRRFKPSQAFAMGLNPDDARNVINFERDSRASEKYVKGESFDVESDDGWALVCADGYPLGWASVKDGRMKNKYFKAWKME
ncbi:MAG: RsmF rRNA methyltransferase first C-terminal domain-containing protein [Clostridiales bacterium]|jgi:NOL1/NOP2/sun family putative RNA methylase|nr:RsmF rRNA methyltransferase first C-terminal domain-containing protein [Clostridiales bacterium]